MLKLTVQIFKWILIYVVGAVIGLFAGANIIGVVFEDYFQRQDPSGFSGILYSGLIGAVLVILFITLVKIWLSRKSKKRS